MVQVELVLEAVALVVQVVLVVVAQVLVVGLVEAVVVPVELQAAELVQLVVAALLAVLVQLVVEVVLVGLALEAALGRHLHTYSWFFGAPSPHPRLDIANCLGHSPSLPAVLLLPSLGCH